MPPLAAPGESLDLPLPGRDVFARVLSQHARLVEIETPLPSASLLVERFTGREALCEIFRFDIDCLSGSVHFPLKALIGEEITLRLLQADGRRRAWHGIVTRAAQLGGDGGLARYRLTLEGWLSEARHRRDCRLFQDRNALEIAEALLSAYPRARFDIRVDPQTLAQLPRHALTTQYRETDLDFLTRVLARDGLVTVFEHDQEGDTGGSGGAPAGDAPASAPGAEPGRPHGKHTLVIVEAHHAWPESEPASLRFHRLSATEAEDGVHRLRAVRQVTPNAVARASWDYRNLIAHGATDALDEADLPVLEDDAGAGQYRHRNGADAERLARLALESFTGLRLTYTLESSVRALGPGRVFTLTGHHAHPAGQDPAGQDRFLPLAVEHQGANNLSPGHAPLLAQPGLEAGTYRNRAYLLPAGVPVVARHRPAPLAPGLASALVVGVEGEALTTERDLRVKIQFPWQRGDKPNPGGLAHPGGAGGAGFAGHAPGNEQSGLWVRLSPSQAGPNWGAHFIPRIGTEVLVGFIDGDIDRPHIVGSLYNGQDPLPWAAGVASGANHPGVIAGHHSVTLEGAGFNQWLADDAPGQLRTRLATSSATSQLSLGYLIHQAPASAQRGAWRGEGFELVTEGWSVLRGAQGLFVSTTARPQGASTQLDAAEAIAQLRAAQDLGGRLSEAAAGQKALALTAHQPQQAFARFIETVDPQALGKYEGPVGGQASTQPTAEARAGGDPVPRWASPVVLADSPDQLLLATPASATLMAGDALAAVAQADAHFAAAHTFAQVSGGTTSVFTHAGGFQAVAAQGPVSLQAHTDRLEVLADKAITVTSTDEAVEILAQHQIRLVAAGAEIVMDGGDITFRGPATWSVRGTAHAFLGPGSEAAGLANLPSPDKLDHWVELNYRDVFAEPIVGAPYKLRFADGTVISGALDAQGFARIDGVPYQPYTVEYGEDVRPVQPRQVADPNPFFGAGSPASAEAAMQRLQAFMDQEDAALKDHYFPDEVAAMQATGEEGSTGASTDAFLDDYLLAGEAAEAQEQASYRSEHPEGKDAQS